MVAARPPAEASAVSDDLAPVELVDKSHRVLAAQLPNALVDPGTVHQAGDATRPVDVTVPDLSGYLELRIVAECLEDMMEARKACVNRIERGGVDKDKFAGPRAAIEAAEHELSLQLVRCYRRVIPIEIRDWVSNSAGIGDRLIARLLGQLGHPRIATPYHWEGTGSERILISDPPYERSVSQLWSYCGWGDPLRKRRVGMTAEDAAGLGKTRLKPIVWNIAVGAIKEHGADIAALLASFPPDLAVQDAEAAPCSPGSDGVDPTIGRSIPGVLTPGPLSPAARHVPDPEAEAQQEGPAVDPAQPEEVTPGPISPAASQLAETIARPRRNGTAIDATTGSTPIDPAPRWPYRLIYDDARIHYAARDWTDGHKHNAAIRKVAKTILRDLWIVAAPPDQSPAGNQIVGVGGNT